MVNILTNDTPLEPKAETCLNDNFSGSKANFSGAQRFFKEKFCVYQFNYPKYNIFVNGKVGDYGNQEYHLKNPSSFVSYGSFYGSDNGETIIESGNGKENILVIGESYDNALLKLLASHFNKLYSIDLRTYQRENNKDFNYKKYVEENAIDKVLFIGAKDFYSMKEFNVEVS